MPTRTEPARDPESRIKELEAALVREQRVSKALREVGLALGTTLDLDPLLQLILRNVTEALEADRATLYLRDEAKDELVSRVMFGGEVRSVRVKVGEGIAGHVARTGKLLLVKDAYKDARFSPELDVVSGYRTTGIIAAPMKNHLGRTIGVIQVLNKARGDFTESDGTLLSALSALAGVSIDNSRLFLSVTQKNMLLLDTKEQLEDRIRDLKLLFDLEHAMGRAGSLEELFTAVLSQALENCEAGAGAVALRDPDGSKVTLHVLEGTDGDMKLYPLSEEQGLLGHAMQTGDVVVTTDAENDPRSDPSLDELVGFPCGSALVVPLPGENGMPIGAIGLYNKATARGFTDADKELVLLIAANASTAVRLQYAREMREREERLMTIGRLLSSVIHDLKTPLTVISGYVQMMQGEEDRSQRVKYAENILKQFDHIGAMQREVLEFARGEKSVLVRKVYLKRFFDDVREQLGADLARHNVELVVDLQDKGTARFDEGKILRVIHNLARNAVEAMEDRGGRFTIRVARDVEGNELILTFSDTGPGIPPDIEHRLFQSFVTSGKQGGTGLGLAIVKKIAEEHGGAISVQSSSRGATFKLRLPQRTQESP